MKSNKCIFCNIHQNNFAPIVYEDELTIAFIDPKQFHPGHTLVIPRNHFNDVRDLDPNTGGALMMTLTKITQAVSSSFPNQGISIWHSIAPAAYQEIPHLHLHVHPRQYKDNFLKVYPEKVPENCNKSILEERAKKLRKILNIS